jgi:hypothetical protein
MIWTFIGIGYVGFVVWWFKIDSSLTDKDGVPYTKDQLWRIKIIRKQDIKYH